MTHLIEIIAADKPISFSCFCVKNIDRQTILLCFVMYFGTFSSLLFVWPYLRIYREIQEMFVGILSSLTCWAVTISISPFIHLIIRTLDHLSNRNVFDLSYSCHAYASWSFCTSWNLFTPIPPKSQSLNK